MLGGQLAEDVSEVRRQRQVAAFVQLVALQARPVAVNFSAAHAVADNEHRIRVSVVGAAISILTRDRKSTRLNSSHGYISYAVFCLKKKNIRREALLHRL